MAREIPPSQEASSSRRPNGDSISNGHGSGSNGYTGSVGFGRNGSGASGTDDDMTYDDSNEPSASPSKKRKREVSLKNVFQKQDANEKMHLTAQLNAFREAAEDARNNIGNLTFDDLQRRVNEQSVVLDRIRDPATAAIDARTILEYTEIGNRKARQFRSDTSAFDCDGFLIKVKNILGLDRRVDEDDNASDIDELDGDEDARQSRTRRARGGGVLGDWAQIGWMASKRQRRVPGLEFMLGPLAVEYTKRVVKERQKKAVLAPVQRPEEIVQNEKKKADDTLTFVKKVGKQLAKLDPDSRGIPFFPFFIHPTSFGQSSENLFFISFLVKDGRAGLHLSSNDEMIITHKQPFAEDGDDEGDAPSGPCQGVMEFDMETWRESMELTRQKAIELYQITEPTIPHREPTSGTKQLGANQWY